MQCPECNGEEFKQDNTRAEIICCNCGLVIQENLLDPKGENIYNEDKRKQKQHTGPPVSLLHYDKGASILITNKDVRGKKISPLQRRDFYRWRKWDNRSKIGTVRRRNMMNAFLELRRLASQLKLPMAIKLEAAKTYRQLVEKDCIRGRNLDSLVAACIYSACREFKVSRSLNEIAKYSLVGSKRIGKDYRYIKRKLGMQSVPPKPNEFIPRISRRVNLSAEAERKAIDIYKNVDSKLPSGRAANGIAAGIVYIAALLCEERRSQEIIAKAAEITDVTLRNRYREINEILGLNVESFI